MVLRRTLPVGELRHRDGVPPSPCPDLRADVLENGIRDPLVVYASRHGGYRVELGNQRLVLALEMGLTELDCEVYGEEIPQGDRRW